MNRKPAAALVLAAAFFAGAAVTLGALRVVEHRDDGPGEYFDRTWPRGGGTDRPWGDRPRTGPPGGSRGERPWSELARLRVTERLAMTLDLTDEQVERIREVMERHRADAQGVWDEVLPVLAAQRDSLNAELERILAPDQFRAFLRHLRADRERELRRRDRGGGRR